MKKPWLTHDIINTKTPWPCQWVMWEVSWDISWDHTLEMLPYKSSSQCEKLSEAIRPFFPYVPYTSLCSDSKRQSQLNTRVTLLTNKTSFRLKVTNNDALVLFLKSKTTLYSIKAKYTYCTMVFPNHQILRLLQNYKFFEIPSYREKYFE